MTTDLNQAVQTVNQILATEKADTGTGRERIEASRKRRKEISTLLDNLYLAQNALRTQLSSLPELPEEEHMDWAEAILAMNNLAILVLDTTSLNQDTDILRIYAIDQSGETMIDLVVQPQRERTANTAYTGISQDEIDQAIPLADAWDAVLYALKGCYIVGFNLEFIQDRFKDNIEHYGLSRFPFRGECLMKQALRYFQIHRYGVKLAEVCARIGYTLKTPAPAQDRAAGQLAILRAMSQGVMSAPSVTKITADTDLGELDENPFF